MRRVIALLLVLFLCTCASAEPRTLHLEWTYPDGVAGLAGFRIYQAAGLVRDILDPLARVDEFEVDLAVGENVFTMTAYDASANESAHSAPYTVQWLPAQPNAIRVFEARARKRVVGGSRPDRGTAAESPLRIKVLPDQERKRSW